VARRLGVERWRNKDRALQANVTAKSLVLVKPQSYMNESGTPISRIARWWKTPPAGVLVVVDDLDLPFGKLRDARVGGSGGHNGLKSIIETLARTFRDCASESDATAMRSDHVLSSFHEATKTNV